MFSTALFGLFITSFLAASLLPVQSEAILVALSIDGQYSDEILLATSTSGNALGAVLNYFLGRYFLHFSDRKWFPVKEKTLTKATKNYHKWGGQWSVLFAWLPIIGDPLTFIAGILKANFYLFLILVTIGKSVRYAFLLYVF